MWYRRNHTDLQNTVNVLVILHGELQKTNPKNSDTIVGYFFQFLHTRNFFFFWLLTWLQLGRQKPPRVV